MEMEMELEMELEMEMEMELELEMEMKMKMEIYLIKRRKGLKRNPVIYQKIYQNYLGVYLHINKMQIL